MVKPQLTFSLLLCIVAANQALALECYQCEDCATGYESKAVTCKAIVPTTTKAPTTTAKSTTTSTLPPSSTEKSTTTSTLPPTSTERKNGTTTTERSNATETTPTSTTEPPVTNTTERSTKPTSTSTTSTTTTTTTLKPPSQEPPKRRRRAVQEPKVVPKCTKFDYMVGNVKKTNRSCIFVQDNEDSCKTKDNCSVCETDKCNSATRLTIASLPFVIGLSLIFK